MGKKTKGKAAVAAKAPKELKPLTEYEIEEGFPVGASEPWIQLLESADLQIEQATDKVEDAKVAVAQAEAGVELARENRRFIEQKIRRAMEMIRNVDLSPVLAMKPYDDALRSLLGKVGDKGAPWSTFAAGASDQDILDNLKGGHVYNNEADGYELDQDRLSRYVAGQMGTVKVAEGKALVADVRRLLAIPQPPKAPKPAKAKAPAKKGKGSGGAVAPPAAPPPADDPKPLDLDSDRLMHERAAAPAAKPVQPLGEWLRNARKVLKRKGGDPFDVKEEAPWTTWHAEGKRPADAAAAWAKGERGEAKGEGKGEEDPAPTAALPTGTLPATRIVEIRPSRPLYFTEVYDAFDLGVSEGEIAAAVDTFDFTKPRPDIHVLAAAVRLGEEGDPHAELHIVRDQSDHVGGAGLILLPLLPKHKAPKLTEADPVTGRPVIVNSQTLYIGNADSGIRVDDKPAAGSPTAKATEDDDGEWDFVKTFPRIVLNPDVPAEYDALLRMGITHDDRGFHGADSDEDPVPLLHEEAISELRGLLGETRNAADVLAGGVYVDAGPRKDGKPMSEKDMAVLREMIRKNRDTMAGSLNWYQDLFGERARQALESLVGMSPAEPEAPLAPGDQDDDDAGELAEPGKVYELEDLDATAPDLRAAFAGQAIKRGDPAKVPVPVSIDGYDFLNVGPVAGHDGDTSGDVVRLVQLQREDSLDAHSILALRNDPKGFYCGRRVQSPGGVVYVVGPEDYDLLVRLPADEADGDGGQD